MNIFFSKMQTFKFNKLNLNGIYQSIYMNSIF